MKPTEAVRSMKGQKVRIETKGGEEMEGVLESVDSYINLLLSDTEEVNGDAGRKLGEVVVRGNNLVYVKPVR